MQRLIEALGNAERVVISEHTDATSQERGDRIVRYGQQQFDCTKDQVEDLQASGARRG